jgi:hypothetical protein
MRKLFRMKYESCNGLCYAYSDVMKIHTLGLNLDGAVTFLNRLLAIHEPSCGNDNLAFRLDADEELEVFVASFQRYGALDLFCGKTPLVAMDKMIDCSLAYFASEQFAKDVDNAPFVDRADVCEHGEDEKLIEFSIAYSGLPQADQDALRARLSQAHQ